MSADAVFTAAVDRLHQIHLRIETDDMPLPLEPSFDAKQEVLALYQPIFSVDHLRSLNETAFRDFLLFRCNSGFGFLLPCMVRTGFFGNPHRRRSLR